MRWMPIFLLAVLLLVLWDAPFQERRIEKLQNSCAVYYLLNIDGMKGLGHAALLLQDEQGNGLLYSYNGMQYSLLECLIGKEGIGKMKVFALSADEICEFLSTGDLKVEDTAECDNFDRVLYRCISREDYEAVQKGTVKYMEAGAEFERLYAAAYDSAGEELEAFLEQEDLPRYQIYTHNCDTVARELIAQIDEEMRQYNSESKRLTPTGNYIGMTHALSRV